MKSLEKPIAMDSTESIERWLPIAEFPAYEVSDRGRVRRCAPDARGRGAGRIFKPSRSHARYSVVGLSRDGVLYHVKIHILVAQAFLGPRPTPDHQVAHWDGNNRNNTLANLRWATAKENAADRDRHGRTARGDRNGAHTKPAHVLRGSDHGLAKLTETEIRAIRCDPRHLKLIAADYPVSFTAIGRIKARKTWKHVA